MKNNILATLVLIALVIIAIFYFTNKNDSTVVPEVVVETTTTTEGFTSEVEYKNSVYGFGVYLPETWEGYSDIEDKWEGYSLEATSEQGQVVTETGPLITIRHPDWEYKSPRQDIPIMVLSILQWNNLSADKFHIGAAPVGPTEIGRNKRYVFAVPARYNYAFSTGYEEVQELFEKNPLYTF